jgi:hypothetical protein
MVRRSPRKRIASVPSLMRASFLVHWTKYTFAVSEGHRARHRWHRGIPALYASGLCRGRARGPGHHRCRSSERRAGAADGERLLPPLNQNFSVLIPPPRVSRKRPQSGGRLEPPTWGGSGGRTAALSNHAASSGAVLFCSCPNLNSRVGRTYAANWAGVVLGLRRRRVTGFS